MTITTNIQTLRSQESGLNLFTAVDSVIDVMDGQILQYKGKVYRSAQAKKNARADSSHAVDSEDIAEAEEESGETIVPEFGKVVRTKRFSMKPMTVRDAVLEMELLSHDFFLF